MLSIPLKSGPSFGKLFLFSRIQTALKGHHLDGNKEIQIAVMAALNEVPVDTSKARTVPGKNV